MAMYCCAAFAQTAAGPGLEAAPSAPDEVRTDSPDTPPPSGFGTPERGGPREFGRQPTPERGENGPNVLPPGAVPAPGVAGESIETPAPITAFNVYSGLSGPRYLKPGDKDRYTFTITNHLRDDLKNIIIFWPKARNLAQQSPGDKSDVLRMSNGTDGFNKDALAEGKLIWTLAELKVGNSKTYSVEYEAERFGEAEISVMVMTSLDKPPITQASLKVGVVETIPEEVEEALVIDLMPTGEPDVAIVEAVAPDVIPATPILPLPVELGSRIVPPAVTTVPTSPADGPKPEAKIEEGAVSIATLKKINPVERRIEAMIAFATFQGQYLDVKSAEKTFEAAISELDEVEQFSLKMRLMGMITERYRVLQRERPTESPVFGQPTNRGDTRSNPEPIRGREVPRPMF